jgi:hypothetical protein
MTLDDALGNEQAEANAPTIIFRQLDETVEHRLQLVVWNAVPCVADGTHHVVIDAFEAYDDRALSARKFQRVAQKIAEHLKNARRIKRN